LAHKRLGIAAAGLSLAMAGVIAVPSASAATGATLYVDNMIGTCTDAGTGTQAAPYCTIQAAAAAAAPGDTVLVAGSDFTTYGTNVEISASGTAAAPITFESVGAPYFTITQLKVSGSYIVVRGGILEGGLPEAAATVTGAHVTFDHDELFGDGSVIVQAGANVDGLTIERSNLSIMGNNSVVQLGSGDTDTVVSSDILSTGTGDISQVGNPAPAAGPDAPAIVLSKDSQTDITGNTFVAECFTGVSVSDSTGTSIENNVIGDQTCHEVGRQDLLVDAASAPSTTEDYNLLSEDGGYVTLYNWAGKTYTTQSAFTAATSQGSHDIAEGSVGLAAGAGDSDAQGNGNASAPGELSTDFYGNAWPDASPDRGAVSADAEPPAPTVTAVAYTPQQVELSLDMHGMDDAGGNVTINWGDGSAAVGDPVPGNAWSDFTDITDYHIYAQRGTYTVTASWGAGSSAVKETTTVTTEGGTYVPVNPTRILDTREGTGAPEAMVGPHGTIAVDVTKGVTIPQNAGTILAVVMNVTATDETTIGVVTVYPDGTPLPTTSNLNYAARQNIPNLVTVKVGSDDKVDLTNGSAGSTDLVADVEGYYVESSAGAYYLPNSPQRILDTRNGTGGTTGPVAPGGTVAVSVPNCTSDGVSAPATAVAVNVTVANPTSIGLITAYPDQTSLPIASNINYAANENVPNMVVVKVGADGKFDLHNTSTGTVQLIADLEGCYSATLGGAFFPVDPYRALDTRTGIGQFEGQPETVAADNDAQWYGAQSGPYYGSQAPAAVVMNVTVTDPQTIGVITAYPGFASLPIASNLNFSGGETVPNLVMVQANGGGAVNLYNGSKGTVQLVADIYGYFS
jgi:hypothetical protein